MDTPMLVETTFEASEAPKVPDRHLLAIPLVVDGPGSPHVEARKGRVVFRTVGWFEVLMTVEWDPTVVHGTRFAHTMVTDHEPLHSEAISAKVLIDLNGGRQLLRGNTIFGLDCTSALELGVWQDSGEAVSVRTARIVVRELHVPWTAAGHP